MSGAPPRIWRLASGCRQELLPKGGPLDKFAHAGLSDEPARLYENVASKQNDIGCARDLGSLVEVVVRLRVLVGGGDQVPPVGIEDHDVRVGPGRDRAFAGVQPEELGRVRGEEL